ncbi:TPA: DUF4041 domain-containing protein [Escherichia coli]|nr:DUF4041 domain-containing protein [Escherichia coli]HBA8150444.1 DUF4041 domain-containing protein [Escherichia coli]
MEFVSKLLALGIIILVFSSPYLIYLLIKNKKRIKNDTLEIESLKSQLENLRDKHEALEKRAEPLWKYTTIHNAELEAERRIAETEKEVQELISKAHLEAETLLDNAREEVFLLNKDAKEKRNKAREKLDEANSKADEIVRLANDNAASLISNAEAKARDIAGSAYEAKKFAEKYQSVVNAMKNKIKGYGDEWIIPNQSVLDELANKYSFKDAGNELKKARELTRTLIKTQKAATCQYVESNRRNTAINFVLDAFNGKVDTILSKVKYNNYGKLLQEIKDAFSLVNFNGEAFREAKITETFLQARINELKWAVAVNEIIQEEKEEQRRIKEQLREEERARKEYERAIKEAEKEERLIRQAMEKARKEMQAANDEQKAMLQKQIEELQQKYEEAEAKNQRAISMAQQTRSGHVYVISNIGSFGENIFKIGMTRRLEPMDRVKELGDASVPFSFDVHAMIYSEDAPSLENELHRKLKKSQVNKINPRKEFFNVPLMEIKSLIDNMNIETHWTLKAEAQEYRESLALLHSEDEGNIENDLIVA